MQHAKTSIGSDLLIDLLFQMFILSWSQPFSHMSSHYRNTMVYHKKDEYNNEIDLVTNHNALQ